MSTTSQTFKSEEFVSVEEQNVVVSQISEEVVEIIEVPATEEVKVEETTTEESAPKAVEEGESRMQKLVTDVTTIVKQITEVAMKKAEEIQETETYKSTRNSVCEKTTELTDKVTQTETYVKVSEKASELKEKIVTSETYAKATEKASELKDVAVVKAGEFKDVAVVKAGELKEVVANHPNTQKAVEKFNEVKEVVATNETVGKMIETSWSVADMTAEKAKAGYECARRRSSEAYVKYEESGMKSKVEELSAVAVEYLKVAASEGCKYTKIGFVVTKKMTKQYTAEYAKFTAELLESESKKVEGAAADTKESSGDKLNRYERRQQKNAKSKSKGDIDFDAIMDVVKENVHKAKMGFYQVTGMIAGKVTEYIVDEEEVAVEEEKKE